jgi:hypothetical protein
LQDSLNETLIELDQKKAEMKHLTHEEAIYRKSVLSNITYDVKLALIKGKTYFGTTKINFVYKASNSTK